MLSSRCAPFHPVFGLLVPIRPPEDFKWPPYPTVTFREANTPYA